MERIYQKQIREAFSEYIQTMDAIYEKLYEHITYITENYSDADVDLIIEGFWDTLKKGAHAVGSAIGKGVSTAKNLAASAVEAGKNLVNKVSNAIKSAASAIAGAPGKAWSFLVNDVWKPILDGSKELLAAAKAEGDAAIETAKQTIKNTYNTVVSGLKSAIESVGAWIAKNAKAFGSYVASVAGDIQAGWNTAKQSADGELKKLGQWWETNWPKIKDGTIDAAKYAAFLSLGLIVLSVQGAYKLVKAGAQGVAAGAQAVAGAATQAGKGALTAMERAWDSVKKNAPEVYQAFKAGYAQGAGTAPAPVPQGTTPAPTTERKVMSWETFLNEKKKAKKEDKEDKEDDKKEDKGKKPMSAKQAAFFKKMGWDKKKK